ncbi:MAG TPA: hypothetical protein VK927_10410, partial [Adhaeribacter sp.]|nr:hypothetical protein [Adhaeribacter sp.]
MSLKKYLIAILFTLGFMGLDHSVSATHLFGGEVKYQFLDANGTTPGRPYRYRVTYLIYWNCGTGAAPANPTINVGFYAKSTTPGAPATPIPSISGSFTFNRVFGPPINPPIPAGCTVTISQCVQLIIYEKVVDLPPSIAGYYTIYSVAARNNGIDNLQNSGGENLTLYADMGPTFRFNNSPVFTDTAVAIVCSGDTATIINNATDPDGDRLIYSFNQPYSGSGPNFPPSTVDYASGYSVSQPFGAGGYAFLNASTGLTKYYIPNPGEYVVSFEIKEYRNINGVEQLVGTSIRDIQLFVSNQCGSNASPRLSIPATSYNVQAGGSVSFNFKGTDADSLTQPLTFSGELFGPDGLKIQDLPKITSNGTGIYSSINFTAPCKPGIYTYNLRVKDVACPFPKTDPKTILINVLPF